MKKEAGIYIRLTEEQKNKLQNLSQKNHETITTLVRNAALNLVNEEREPNLSDDVYEIAPLCREVTVSLTEEEYQKFKFEAEKDGLALTQLGRRKLVKSQNIISLPIETEDLTEVVAVLSPQLRKVGVVLEVIKKQRIQNEKQLDDIQKRLDDIETCLKTLLKETLKNRKSLKKEVLAKLRKTINQIQKER